MSASERRGICCAGNWIIDHVKTIDVWPEEEALANIVAEEIGTGGAPYNVIVDLARFGLEIPLSGLGLVGEDSDGERILADCVSRGIDTRHLLRIQGTPTAYTVVMNVRSTGRRTFFHHRGANARLAPEHFPLDRLACRILSLGYLLLLDGMDAPDESFGTCAARVLAGARERGILTAVDVVSEASDRFARIVRPALPHIDYLIVNEIEATKTTGHRARSDAGVLDVAAIETSARELIALGVHRAVVIHTPELSLAMERDGTLHHRSSLRVPDRGFIVGAAGAGDAFFAGMIAGIHEGWSIDDSLAFACGAAASCLRHPTCTGGVGSAEEIRDLERELGWRAVSEQGDRR